MRKRRPVDVETLRYVIRRLSRERRREASIKLASPYGTESFYRSYGAETALSIVIAELRQVVRDKGALP